MAALENALMHTPTDAVLKSLNRGTTVPFADAFLTEVDRVGTLFDDIAPNGPGKTVRLHITYVNDEDHFVVETRMGLIRVRSIVFDGELRVKQSLVPLSVTAEYREVDSGRAISQLAAFAPQNVNGARFSIELHRMAESGETHIAMRKLDDDK
jgi:hypothetical protein